MTTFLDRAIFTATSGGTGSFTEGSAVLGFQTIEAAGGATGAILGYAAQSSGFDQWEVGRGVWTAATKRLTRTPLFTSNGNTSPVNFTAPPQVMITALAEDIVLATPPGDLFNTSGVTVVAAHSIARKLFASYSGKLFQVKRASDSTTLDVGVLDGGFADVATLATFLLGTTGKVTTIYDQTGNANHLPQATGANQGTVNIRYTSLGRPIPVVSCLSGHFYRNRSSTTHIPTGSNPTTQYMVVTNALYPNPGIGQYGNMETTVADTGTGHMFALAWSIGDTGFTNPGPGPYVGVDFENGISDGETLSPTEWADFIVVLSKVQTSSPQWVLKGGAAGANNLPTIYSNTLPSFVSGAGGMHLEGGISLGEGGDGSPAPVEFVEGVITAGFTSDAADNAVQSNLAQIFGNSGAWTQYPDGLATGSPLLFRYGAVFNKLAIDNSYKVMADLCYTASGVFNFNDLTAGFGQIKTNYVTLQAASAGQPGMTASLSTDTPSGLTGWRVTAQLDANNNGFVGFGPGGTSAGDLILTRQQAGTLGLYTGTTSSGPTGLWAYNSVVSGTNYERGVFDWVTAANVLTIGTQKGGGGGSTRPIEFISGGTNVLDFGVTSANEWTIGGTGGYSLIYCQYWVGKGPTTTAPSFSFKINTDGGGTGRVFIGLDTSDVPFVGFNGTTAAGQPGDAIINRQSSGVLGIGTSTTNTGGSIKLTDLFTNNATFLIRTGTTLSNGAAANTGTLTNAPAAGNPTKWISIDDNGTTRKIPAW